MEKPQKSTQNHEQKQRKTLEDYVVKTFPTDTDPDNARYPLTIIRRGQDGEDVKYDGGWNPIGMLAVCDTDSEKGIGPIKLFMEVYKLVKVDGEYTTETEIVLLENIQGLEANEDYIKYLYGKTTKEMIEKGVEAAEQIWRQKYPANNGSESSTTGTRPENSGDGSAVKEVSGHERPSADKADPVMGGVAVNAAGVRKPVETNKVDTNEPVRKPVKKDEAGAGSSALAMTEGVMEPIGAIKVNDSVGLPAVEPAKKPAETDKVGANPADLVAAEPVKKPVEADKASADLVDLPAAKSVESPVVEKSMETNEANTDILPEGLKTVINNFKQPTEENGVEFNGEAKKLNASLSQLRESIKITPAAIRDSRITEFITIASLRIRELEDSRSEYANKFKDGVSSLIEELKNKIKNDDKQRICLIKLTEVVDKMSVDSTALGDATNTLIDKLTEIVRIVSDAQNDRW